MKQYRPEGSMVTGLQNWINTIPEADRGTLVEVGAAAGEGTVMFAEAFKRVICVDPWAKAKYFQAWKERTKQYKTVSAWQAYSVDIARRYASEHVTFDVVYIDAIHDYEHVSQDIKAWLPLVRKGGYIGGHDYSKKFDGCIRAVAEAFPGKSVYQFADTSWLIKLGCEDKQ